MLWIEVSDDIEKLSSKYVLMFTNEKQAQLRLCKLGPGTVFLISFFSEIEILSVAPLSQASLVVVCMLTSTYDFQAKSQLPI